MYRIGLISDTHMPERCPALPDSLFDAFRDVDLILHAGDLGELWVLDRLSQIAPAVAVHGNDDTSDAQRELPAQQLVSTAGWRILLWHSHYPDPAEDKAQRGGPWAPKLARIAGAGRRVGAEIVVYGHFHIPLAYRQGDILLINPGALASGSLFTRQAIRSVARLTIHDDGTLSVTHVDLADSSRTYTPEIDMEAGVEAAVDRFQAMIVEDDLLEDVRRLRAQPYTDLEALNKTILPLCYPCWAGEKQHITRAELIAKIGNSGSIFEDDKEKALVILAGKI